MIFVKKILSILKILLIKGWQLLCQTLSLLRPGKTFTSKLVFRMALVCTLIFVINAVWTVVSTCSVLFKDSAQKAQKEIAVANAVCERAEASTDTITTVRLYKMLHDAGIDSDFNMCITDSAMHIVSCTDSTWVGDSIRTQFFSDEMDLDIDVIDDKMSITQFRGEIYELLMDEIGDMKFYIVLMKPASKVLMPIVDIAWSIGKSSFNCLLILVLCYLIMLYLFRRSTSRNQQIESEMAVAANVQHQMIPHDFSTFPESHGYALHGLLTPAKVMGGDLFDYVLTDDKLLFCIGDVSGKGMPAALFMSEVHILFRHVLEYGHDPANIATAMNRSLSQGNDSNMFCTTFIGVLDFSTNILSYCNAGHNPGVVLHADGTAQFLDVMPNIALGLFGDFPYQKQEILLEQGDGLFCYTDGITEAENIQKQLFSDDKVLQTVSGQQSLTPAAICDLVLSSVLEHTKMTDQSDDITMLCLKRQ